MDRERHWDQRNSPPKPCTLNPKQHQMDASSIVAAWKGVMDDTVFEK